MGYSTTVVVLNDALGCIENDPDFGKKLAAAIRENGVGRNMIGVCAGNHCNAALVVETHHSSHYETVRVGRNTGEVVP